MNILGSTGAYGRMMMWLGGAGLVTGLVAYVPSPLSIVELFQSAPVQEVRAVPTLKLVQMPGIERFDEIAKRPLFNPERVPDPAQSPAGGAPAASGGLALGDLAQYRLVGIAGDTETRIALVQKTGGSLMTVKPGDSLDGWTVTAIDARGVAIAGGGRKEILTIPRAVNRSQSP